MTGPRRILLIDAHPDGRDRHFGHALASAYATAAEKAGHEVRVVRLADIDVPLLTSQQSWASREAPPSLRGAQRDIGWADHLVIIYPLWLGDMPALLKAFLEQVLRPGFAFRYSGTKMRPDLKGRSARIIVTMGMPGWVYRYYFGAHTLRSLKRNILHFVGIRPVRYTILGGIDEENPRGPRHLARIARLGREAR